jgi:hypothetical protein
MCYFRCTAKIAETLSEQRAIDLTSALPAALAQLPDVRIRGVDTDVRVDGKEYDLVVVAEVKGRPVRLLIEVKASGYPRDVQHAIWQLADVPRAKQEVVDVPLVAAPAISEASRELLRRHKLGYWDTGGSVYIELPWALYWVDRPTPVRQTRVLRRIYRGSTAQVLHALLLEPGKPWHVSELAKCATVSVSTVHQVCTFLEEQLWMAQEGKGPRSVRVLHQPGALLDAWAGAHSLAEYEVRRFHRWARQSADLLRPVTEALIHLGVEHALTLGSGAQLVAPHGTGTEHAWVLLLAPAASHLDEVARAADLQPVDEGETVSFLLTRDRSPLLFRQQVQDYWVASNVQLYLDLWAWPQRGKEQARHLRDERLGY